MLNLRQCLAESLGVFVKGDDMLAVQCAVSDVRVEAGVFRPWGMVPDTTDSTVWVEGQLSLASEVIDLRLVVSPKDFSLLALWSPLRWTGKLTDPELVVERGPIGLKLAAAVALALVNPLAAVIPLLDPGDSDEARRGACGGPLTAGLLAYSSRVFVFFCPCGSPWPRG